MLDKQDLQAIAELMAAQEERILGKVNTMFDVQEERILGKVNAMFDVQEERILGKVNAIIEVNVMPPIKLIAEQHGDILARLPDVEEQERLKSRVRVLENVVVDLRREVDELKKAL